MEVTVEEVSSVVRRLKIDVNAQRVKQEIDKVSRDVSKRVRIPGFRPGKAPRGMIEKRFWPEISRQVVESLVESTLFEAVREKDIPIVATTDVQHGTLAKGEDYKYEVEIEVRPTIELSEYKGLNGQKPQVEAKQDEIDAELDRMRKAQRTFVVVDDRNTTQVGDLLSMNYTITEDGEVLSEQENASFPLGEGHFLPDNEALLIGKEVPSEIEEEVTYPEDFTVKSLAGKTVTVKIALQEIKTEELPALDDAFAEEAGEENLDALLEKIKGQIVERKDKEARNFLEDKLYDSLLSNHEFEIPRSMVRQRAERMVQSTFQQLAMYNPGLGNQFSPQLMNQLIADSEPRAEREVRISLLMNQIAEAEKIEVDEEAINEELNSIAASSGQTVEKIRAEFAKENAIEGLKLMLAKRKTMDLLIEHAQVEELSEEQLKEIAEKEKAEKEQAAKEAAEQAAAAVNAPADDTAESSDEGAADAEGESNEEAASEE